MHLKKMAGVAVQSHLAKTLGELLIYISGSYQYIRTKARPTELSYHDHTTLQTLESDR